MKPQDICIYQGINENWFIKLNGKIIASSVSETLVKEIVKLLYNEPDLNLKVQKDYSQRLPQSETIKTENETR